MSLEPIPDPAYCPPLNAYFLSAGKTLVYQCLSYPLCRIYWENDKPTPWVVESAWYDTGDPVKGWRRSGPNFPSFIAVCICTDTGDRIGEPRYITLRHKPVWAHNLSDLITTITEAKEECQNNKVSPPLLNLREVVVERMAMCNM